MNQETVLGMVLSAMPVGDYDKRLVLLTKEYGKIAAFAKGARKPNCTLLAGSQPFAFGEFQIYQGRNSYTIVSAEIRNYFEQLRDDLEGACYGFYFCEFVEYMTHENQDEIEILKLLYQTLRAITTEAIPNPLIRAIFEIKILCLNGEAPQVFECVKCGIDEEKMVFSSFAGGLLCRECQKKFLYSNVKLSPAALYALQFIVATPVEKLYTFTVKQSVLKELQKIAEDYLKIYINHNFKALEMLQVF
ncbi:DNA repair protein RecO [Velocimicrobium porci]|uniref:DNA repair protein RecO n=1 Tax=Velocimicrobium porci TaxID=2606634 RepID=A0A6L5XUP8_9FIRM|nr:DNA repair protein RecO [Velocimicrobium porci]MSS62535.1 DNA repair protein RecO [Velocimicrobium porci]